MRKPTKPNPYHGTPCLPRELIQSYMKGEPYVGGFEKHDIIYESEFKHRNIHAQGYILEQLTKLKHEYEIAVNIKKMHLRNGRKRKALQTGKHIRELRNQIEQIEYDIQGETYHETIGYDSGTNYGSGIEDYSMEDEEEELSFSDLPRPQRKIKNYVREILFSKKQHETATGYYIGFLPSGAKAIYVPTQWEINIDMTIFLWDLDKQFANRYVFINTASIAGMDVAQTIISVWKYYGKIVNNVLNLILDYNLRLLPILPHLAYVQYDDRWYEDYEWVVSFHKPFSRTQEDSLIYPVFGWRGYYKKRRGWK